MRLSRNHRYLLLLAALFALATLRRTDLPGEEVLPDLYRATLHRPLVAPVAAAAHGDAAARAALESELAAARLDVARYKELLERTHELEKCFASLRWEAPSRAIPAWVVLAESDDYRRMFVIDRGADDGLRPGQPVVMGRALLGVVAKVDRRTATVRRIDDPSFRLEVEIETAQGEVVRGIARGDGAKGLDVRFVPRTESLGRGSAVFTTAYHRDIPAGLVVGAVEKVGDVDQDGIHEVSVTPAAALGRWALVHVLDKPVPPGVGLR